MGKSSASKGLLVLILVLSSVVGHAGDSDDRASRCAALARARKAANDKKEKSAEDIVLALKSDPECDGGGKSRQTIDEFKASYKTWSTCIHGGGGSSCGEPPVVQ